MDRLTTRGWLDQRQPAITPALLVCITLVYVLQLWMANRVGPAADLYLGALPATPLSFTEPWRLLSYAMLHGSPTHLLMNGWVLWSMGGMLERLIGRGRMLLVYVLSALGGGLAVVLFASGVHLGASGAIWGLMTATFVLIWRSTGMPRDMRSVLLRDFGQNLVINTLLSFLPGISLAGHFGGGAAGALVAFSGLATVGLGPSGTPGWYRALMIGLGGLLVGCTLIALGVGLVGQLG